MIIARARQRAARQSIYQDRTSPSDFAAFRFVPKSHKWFHELALPVFHRISEWRYPLDVDHYSVPRLISFLAAMRAELPCHFHSQVLQRLLPHFVRVPGSTDKSHYW